VMERIAKCSRVKENFRIEAAGRFSQASQELAKRWEMERSDETYSSCIASQTWNGSTKLLCFPSSSSFSTPHVFPPDDPG
jgi:hypothetical protein